MYICIKPVKDCYISSSNPCAFEFFTVLCKKFCFVYEEMNQKLLFFFGLISVSFVLSLIGIYLTL